MYSGASNAQIYTTFCKTLVEFYKRLSAIDLQIPGSPTRIISFAVCANFVLGLFYKLP